MPPRWLAPPPLTDIFADFFGICISSHSRQIADADALICLRRRHAPEREVSPQLFAAA